MVGSSRGLGFQIFILATRVRIPYQLLNLGHRIRVITRDFGSWNLSSNLSDPTKNNVMSDKKENIIELLHKSGFIYLMLGSLISSDTLLSVKDCEKSLKELEKLNEALKEANIKEEKKKEYQDFIDRGFEIVKRDLEKFKEKMETDA